MEDLSLHILDVVENAIAAKARRIEISVLEEIEEDRLTIEIKDDGIGMDEEVRQKAADPFFTTRTSRRVGLGLSFLAQAAEEAGGKLEIESRPGDGTKVRATFQHGHIDRKPLGSMSETMVMLFLGNPDVDFHYNHMKGEKSYTLKSQWMRERFPDQSYMAPDAIQWLRKHLQEGLSEIGAYSV
ncbi:MAG: ATP-binding protein [Deltaproteobacteria bacterium]|nr:ATP-binding protein [Deltaproteobacteria bacterium]